MGHELILLGIAFLLAGLLARAGRRVGLPTIPFFMPPGSSSARTRPGPCCSTTPRTSSSSPPSA